MTTVIYMLPTEGRSPYDFPSLCVFINIHSLAARLFRVGFFSPDLFANTLFVSRKIVED